MTLACVCGSDLWYYRGESTHEPGAIGHEFIGTVEAVGSAVTTLAEGDLVIAPFLYSDGTCEMCLAGKPAHCLNGGGWGNATGGGQGERVRVPLADGTLVKVPGAGHGDGALRSLLAQRREHGPRPRDTERRQRGVADACRGRPGLHTTPVAAAPTITTASARTATPVHMNVVAE